MWLPVHFGQALFNTRYDHAFPGVSQRSLKNKTRITNRWAEECFCFLILKLGRRGKVLGGTSAINFEVWSRASKDEYDALAEFANDKTWGWEGFLDQFKRLEDYSPPPPDAIFPGVEKPFRQKIFSSIQERLYGHGDSKNEFYHGKGGPIQVEC